MNSHRRLLTGVSIHYPFGVNECDGDITPIIQAEFLKLTNQSRAFKNLSPKIENR